MTSLCCLQGTISSAIVPTSTTTAPTKTLPENNNGKTSRFKPLSSSPPKSLSSSKKNLLGDQENTPPSSPDLIILSPDLLLSVPETPDSEIRPNRTPASKSRGQHCLQSRGDASGLGNVDKLSPICRSSHRERREELRSVSVKRLFGSHDESNNAKRSRTDNTQLTRKFSGPKTNGIKVTSPTIAIKKTCPPRDYLLKEFLQSIGGQSERSQGQGSALS